MSRINHRIFLAGVLSFVFFFSFFQFSQAGFFDWFRKNDLQEAATVVSKTKQHTLSVSKSGLGVVTSDDKKINCGKQCKASYPANSKIVLKAEAGNNYKFGRWNGCDKVLGGKCQTTLNKSKTIVAKFTSKRTSSSSSSQKSSNSSKSSQFSSKTSSSKSSSASSKADSSKTLSSSSSIKNSSSVSKSFSSSPIFSPGISSIINSNEIDKKVFVVEDDGTLIRTGCVQSESGCKDVTDRVDKEKVIRKFFDNNPEAKNNYDFIVIMTTFKPGTENGEFRHTKNIIKGSRYDIEIGSFSGVWAILGLTGNERLQGYAFVGDIDSVINRKFYPIIHEVSHRWLFDLGCWGENLRCSHNLQHSGSHYSQDINTVTKEENKTYQDPNSYSDTFIEINPKNPEYCIGKDVNNTEYKFNNLSLYLMGLAAPEEVKPLKWYQINGDRNEIWSEKGVPCTEKALGVQDVINLIGARNPPFLNAQKDFSVAYLLLTRKDEELSGSQIGKVNFLANQFPKEWYKATSHKSTINGINSF